MKESILTKTLFQHLKAREAFYDYSPMLLRLDLFWRNLSMSTLQSTCTRGISEWLAQRPEGNSTAKCDAALFVRQGTLIGDGCIKKCFNFQTISEQRCASGVMGKDQWIVTLRNTAVAVEPV